MSHEDVGADAERDGEQKPEAVTEIGIRTAPREKAAKTAKKVAPPPPPVALDPDAASGDETFAAFDPKDALGEAYDAFAEALGDRHTLFWREVPASGLTSVKAVRSLAADLASEARDKCPPGRTPEVATFDLVGIGDKVFIGARVRFA